MGGKTVVEVRKELEGIAKMRLKGSGSWTGMVAIGKYR